ncbi:MAG TPA: hypothetical protein VE870_00590 [Bacteroidales bacterium]|nr:hypothetical protein [Bacteroidales bacterium]
MKTLFYFFVLGFASTTMLTSAQNSAMVKFPDELPDGLELADSPRTYEMTTDYYAYDLNAHFLNKRQFVATITRGLEGDSARWNEVNYSESADSYAPFPRGEKLNYLHDYTFKADAGIVNPGFFRDLPEANTFVKNLFWDVLGFDVFAYCCWDSLKLNQEYSARDINGEVDLAGVGTFNNKDIKVTWLGITRMNGELCAVIKYSVMNNPLSLKLENMSMTGRSHYWGEVYVSLEDKQIEYAGLSEDVLTNVKLKGMADELRGYTVRNIKLKKIN